MKILVCFKSVPDPNETSVPGAAVSTAKSVINPFDEIAIEEALRIRERGEAAEITGVTIGGPAVDEQIRSALAMGVDRAIRIDDSRLLDPYALARILKAIVEKEAPRILRHWYDVLKPGWVVSSGFDLFNEEGIQVFEAADLDPEWRRVRRPAGRYVSTGWIPGNLLSEGSLLVGVFLSTMEPIIMQAMEPSVVGFQVVDSIDGDTARGDWADRWPGIVRPMLKWTTSFTPVDAEMSAAGRLTNAAAR